MLPVGSMVNLLPKLVRDLSRDQGKQADLIIEGSDIEIDKRILEELKDPLIHLLRNCVDHGLLKPEERAAQNKPPQGTIRLRFATLDSRQAEVSISDDGEGIDLEKVKKAAVNNNLISAGKAAELDRRETLELIFQSGVSTSPLITDLSGRGLGMAIVRQHVERLGGELEVDSKEHEGTSFRLRLPMTLATFRGVLVRVGEQQFLLPTVNTIRVLRVDPEDIKTVENQRTIRLGGEVLSLVSLSACLGIPELPGASSPESRDPGQAEGTGQLPVLVLASGGRRIAFAVDQILGEQQVLLKSLGRQLARVRNIAGAAVLGSGRVTPGAQSVGFDDLGSAHQRGDRDSGGKRGYQNRAYSGGRGFHHRPHSYQKHTGDGRLSGDRHGGWHGRTHPRAQRGVRPGGLGCGHAAHERLRAYDEAARKPQIVRAAGDPGDRLGIARRP